MSKNKIYIRNIVTEEELTLKEGWKNGKSHAFRKRCYAILLSNKGQDAKEISTMLSVNKQTVYVWLNNWKKHGIIGLITQVGQGRKPILNINNEDHVKVVEKAAEEAAKEGTNMKEKITEELKLDRPFSQRTLRRFLQKKNMPTNDFVDYLGKPRTKKI